MRRGILAAVAVIVLGVAGFAVAAIPSDGTINGCYNNATGALRIVESAGDCRTNETTISFAQKGETGDRGPTGPEGPKGATGEQGPAGKDAPAALPAHRFQVGTASIYAGPTDAEPLYSFALFGFKQGYRQLGGSQAGGGAGAGKVEIDQALLTKRFTPESTKLWHDLALSRRFAKAQVTLERAGQVDATFTYEDVTFSEVAHRGGGEVLEKLALVAGRHRVDFGSEPPAAEDAGGALQLGPRAGAFDEFSWGVARPATVSGGGSGIGRANFSSLDMQGNIDGLSEELFRAVTLGRHHPEARINLTGTVGATPLAHTYELEDVVVTSYEIAHEGRASGTPARQSFSLQGASMTQSQAPASVFGAPCYDITEVSAC